VTSVTAQFTRGLERRRAGVLLHPTSLPEAATAGVLGAAATRFLDWLASAGMSVWQMLPVGPVGADRSPYYARSNHAGNPALIDLGSLMELGLLPAAVASGAATHAAQLESACARLASDRSARLAQQLAQFVAREAHWLPDFALFTAVQVEQAGLPWWSWPAALRDREPAALHAARERLWSSLLRVECEQFLFHRQWAELRQRAAERGVLLFGDLPIYPSADSVEVWAHRRLFRLDASGRPAVVAGVPPDYFSADGQVWGNPLYDWERHVAEGFAWWRARLQGQHRLFDLLRIDHFRGLEACWEIPADAPTAREGRWCPAPGVELLTALAAVPVPSALIAEDLGVITPEVEALRDRFGLPGMRVLQFGFDGAASNPHLPHNYLRNCVAYSGTHDNDTTSGWYRQLNHDTRRQVHDYLACDGADMPEALVRAVLQSVAVLAVIPLQDLLGFDSDSRMNTPGTVTGNWTWGFSWTQVPRELAARCHRANELYGRL
jgi:4-alpha-glucanotransferase